MEKQGPEWRRTTYARGRARWTCTAQRAGAHGGRDCRCGGPGGRRSRQGRLASVVCALDAIEAGRAEHGGAEPAQAALQAVDAALSRRAPLHRRSALLVSLQIFLRAFGTGGGAGVHGCLRLCAMTLDGNAHACRMVEEASQADANGGHSLAQFRRAPLQDSASRAAQEPAAKGLPTRAVR